MRVSAHRMAFACNTQSAPLDLDDGSDWRMAVVIWVYGGARIPRAPTLFEVADVDTGDINWVNPDLVTHIVPRV